MVIVQTDGTVILESGDPNYVNLVLGGSPSPENQLLDATADSKPITQLILETFGLPFSTPVLGSNLPGYDIKNQDPILMMKLSLTAELLNDDFAEVELDEFGIARFYVVGDVAATDLDIRYCVPTSQFRMPADLVIVRGYDPPPRRELRTSFDGLKNKNIFDYVDCARGSCEEQYTSRYATISYDDPALDQVYLDDIRNSYELAAFESLLGYLIDLDLPDGIDTVPGLKITFGDTTKEFIKTSASLINGNVNSNTTTGGIGNDGSRSSVGSTSADIVSADQNNFCNFPEEKMIGSKVVFPRSRFLRLNKYGRLESDFAGVVDVVFSGHKVTRLATSPGASGVTDGSVTWTVKRRRDLISLEHGKNWTWTVDGDENVILYFYNQIDSALAETTCDIYSNPSSISSQPVQLGLFYSDNAVNSIVPSSGDFICNIGDNLGYYVPDGTLCIMIERKRPSVDVFDPRGNALAIAEEIRITYTPIVIIDEPAPIAYASTNSGLTSDDGTRTLPAFGILDQTDGIVDADPTTTQDLEDSSISILQDNTNGATIDLSLPFCDANQALTIARNLLALQNETIDTKSIILGPDSDPKLGQLLPDGSVINEIQYSYSDAGQYLITVTSGPKYLTVGSFNNSSYQLQTEDVSKDGVVVQDKGNGAEYVVRIDGFGEITALSMVLDDISVGDRVSVRIFNQAAERI